MGHSMVALGARQRAEMLLKFFSGIDMPYKHAAGAALRSNMYRVCMRDAWYASCKAGFNLKTLNNHLAAAYKCC